MTVYDKLNLAIIFHGLISAGGMFIAGKIIADAIRSTQEGGP